jgi:hypothetical protein
MKKYRYVIVCSNGSSHDLALNEPFTPYGLTARDVYDLPELLRSGWRPVRETPMGGCGNEMVSFSLILLEKDFPDRIDVDEVTPA